MESSSHQRVQARIRSLEREYRGKGYKVITSPDSEDLPAPLKQYEPDLIAHKGDEFLFVEVKTRETVRSSKYLEKLAKAITLVKGWEFELVLTNPGQRRKIRREELVDFKQLRRRLRFARNTARLGDLNLGALILWVVAETALRHLASDQGVSIAQASSNRLVKELHSLGLLSKRQNKGLIALANRRNRVAHGYAPPIDHDQYATFVTVVEELFESLENLPQEQQ